MLTKVRLNVRLMVTCDVLASPVRFRLQSSHHLVISDPGSSGLRQGKLIGWGVCPCELGLELRRLDKNNVRHSSIMLYCGPRLAHNST